MTNQGESSIPNSSNLSSNLNSREPGLNGNRQVEAHDIDFGKYSLEYYEEDLSRCHTKEHFIHFMKLLAKDSHTNPDLWGSESIDQYLEAIAACCSEHPYMQAGDPFVKDHEYIDHLRPYVESVTSSHFYGVDEDGVEHPVHVDLHDYLEKESPWSVMAKIFMCGKYYE